MSIPNTGSRFSGATDANHGVTLKLHKAHGAGMGFDLSIKDYVLGAFLTAATPASAEIWTDGGLFDPLASAANQWAWSNQNAVDLSAQLPNYAMDNKNKNYQANALRNFLALYSVTREDGMPEEVSDNIAGNGTWDDLPQHIANGANPDQKRRIVRALFGDGTKAGSIIRKVYIGGDKDVLAKDDGLTAGAKQAEHERMRDVLGYLGVEATNSDSHHNHFHVTLRPPTVAPVDIGGSLLLAAGPASSGGQTDGVGAATNTDSQAEHDAVMSICDIVAASDHPDLMHFNGISAWGAVQAYFHERGSDLEFSEKVLATVSKGPSHGELISSQKYPGSYTYRPNAGYIGPDQMTLETEVRGKKFKVIYSVDVTAGDPALSYPDDPCPGGHQIYELPSGGKKGGALNILELPTAGPVPPERLAELPAALSFSFGFQ